MQTSQQLRQRPAQKPHSLVSTTMTSQRRLSLSLASTMVPSITGLFLGNKNNSHPHSWPFPTTTRTSATAPASPYDVTMTTSSPGLTMSPARPMTITMAIIPTRTAPSPSSDFLDSHVQGFDRLVFQCVCVSISWDAWPLR